MAREDGRGAQHEVSGVRREVCKVGGGVKGEVREDLLPVSARRGKVGVKQEGGERTRACDRNACGASQQHHYVTMLSAT
jgi:hypothetical protein